MKKTLIMIFFLLLSSATCFAQTSFSGLTPGKSTRAEVDRVFGQPQSKVSETLIEYQPQPLTSKIFVQYRKGSQVVERIEVFCHLEKSFCSDFLHSLNVPMRDDDWEATNDHDAEKTVEYYRAPYYIVLTMLKAKFGDEGWERTALYSRELYEAAVASPQVKFRNKASERGPSTQSRNGSGVIELKNTDLPDYLRPPAGATSATTTRSTQPPSSSTDCFAGHAGIANQSVTFHRDWARQQNAGDIDTHLKVKLTFLFRCSLLDDDWLAQVFADLSVYIANHVPNANCFNGDSGAINRGESSHYNWAKSKSRGEILNNLLWKMSAALRCLDRETQTNFYADVSVTIAYSGVKRKHVRNILPPIRESIVDATDWRTSSV